MSEQQINEEVAVEEIKPTVETEDNNGSYPMDMNPFKIKINIFPTLEKPHYVTHILSKPTFDQEEARERKMPLITSDAGKVEGNDASSSTIDDEPANVALYDKILQGVQGYVLTKGDKVTDKVVPPDEKVPTAEGESTVRALIPLGHKSTAINGMFPSVFEIELEDEDMAFALGGGREWRIRQDLGGRMKREDGTLSPPDYSVYYNFREPKESERKKFRNEAIIALNVRTKAGMTERRSVNLRVVRDLFNALILSVENATVSNTAFDARNPMHLEQVPANFKKGSVIKLFNFLESDLGN